MKPNNGQFVGCETIPELGDEVYVPSELYVYRGHDDTMGGKAHVCAVEEGVSAGKPAPFIRLTGVKGRFNWQMLETEQEALRIRFGDALAHPDPDLRPEFNQPDADWQRV